MTKMLLKWAVLISLCVTAAPNLCVAGFDYTSKYQTLSIIKNRFLMAGLNRSNGRFVIQTLEGDPNQFLGSGKELLTPTSTPWDYQWGAESSFTTVRIDGRNYIFGNNYGSAASIISTEKMDQETHETVWKAKGVEVTQKLHIPSDQLDLNAGMVRIGYTIKNTSEEEREVGTRILFDLALGKSDCPDVFTPKTGDQSISTETQFVNQNIPEHWQTQYPFETMPFKINATGILKGNAGEEPDRFTIGHWESFIKHKWFYTPDSELDFTTKENKYNASDAAVATYWEPVMLQPGESVYYETLYGIGSNLVSKKPLEPENIHCPARAELNAEKDGYKEFEVDFNFKNNYDKPINNIRFGLYHYGGFDITGYRRASIHGMLYGDDARKISSLAPGAGATVTATVQITGMKKNAHIYTLETIYGYTDPDTGELEGDAYKHQIIAPSIQNWPSMTFSGITPDNVYYSDPCAIRIAGSGFNDLDVSDLQITLQNKEDPLNNIPIIDRNVYKVTDNLMIVAIPAYKEANKQLKMDKEYKLSIKTDESSLVGGHTYTTTLTSSSKKRYLNRDYGILVFYENDNYVYKMKLLKNERELKTFRRHNSVMLVIRGSIQGNSEDGFEIGDGAVIASTVTYRPKEGEELGKMIAAKYPEDEEHDSDYIRLDGNGILSVPGTDIVKGAFSIVLEDGIHYQYYTSPSWSEPPWKTETDWGDDFTEEPEKEYVEITRESDAVNFIQKISGFSVIVNSVRMNRAGGVSLVGKLGFFNDNLVNAGIDVQDIRYSSSGYEGIRGMGTVAVPDGILNSVIGLDAEGTLFFDDIINKYGMYLNFGINLLSTEGTLIFAAPSKETKGWPVPDTIQFEVASKKGIPVIPPTTVLKIVRGGGSIGNLVSVLDPYNELETRENNSPPPAPWISFTGGIADSTGKVLKGDPVTLTISTNKFEASGDLHLFKEKLGDAILRVYEDTGQSGITVDIEGGMAFSDPVTGLLNVDGTVRVYIGYDSNNMDNPLYPLIVGGNGRFDGELLGFDVGTASAGLSNSCVYIRGNILNNIDVGVKYIWSENSFVKARGPHADDADAGRGHFTQETSDGGVVSIDNFKLLDSSREKRRNLAVPRSETSSIAIHDIDINKSGKLLLRLSYDGSLPDVSLTRPDGSEFELIEDENYFCSQQDSDSHKQITILLENPKLGQWRLMSSSAVDYELILAEELPAVTALELTDAVVNVEKDNTAKLFLSTSKAKGLKARFYICKDQKEVGTLVGEYELAKNHSVIQIGLPGNLTPGKHYVRVELLQDGNNIDSLYSETTLDIVNSKTPREPASVTLENAGGNKLKASWESIGEKAEGYYIEILDKNEQPLQNTGMIYHKRREGDTQQAVIPGMWKHNDDTVGLSDGTTYKIAVQAVAKVTQTNDTRSESEITYKSSRTISDPVIYRQADPPHLDVTLGNNGGELEAGTYQKQTVYLSNVHDISVAVVSDMDADFEFKLDGEVMKYAEGQSTEASIKLSEGTNELLVSAENKYGDVSKKEFIVYADTKDPNLMIDSPQPGQVVEGGNIEVIGFAEPNTQVTVNSQEAERNEDGTFSLNLDMGNHQSKTISVKAEDAVGNVTFWETKVIAQNNAQIESVSIEVKENSLEYQKTVPLLLRASYSDGNEVIVDNRNVEWSVESGLEYADITTDGQLIIHDSAPVFVKASYALSDEFTVEDIRKFDIGDHRSDSASVTVSTVVTNDTTPTLTGTVGDAQATIKVAVNHNQYTAVNNGDGSWTLADDTISPALEAGVYDVQATATDSDGHEHNDSTEDELQIDLTAQSVTVAASDDITNKAPLLFGVAFSEEVNGFEADDLTVTNGVVRTGGLGKETDTEYVVQVDPSSSSEVSVQLDAGVVMDNAGNANLASNVSTVLYDDEAPDAPIITTPVDDAFIHSLPLDITGTAEAGAMVWVYLDEALLGVAFANDNGEWKVILENETAYHGGEVAIQAQATDPAGNRSTMSEKVEVTIGANVFAIDLMLEEDGHERGDLTLGTRPDASDAFSSPEGDVAVNSKPDKNDDAPEFYSQGTDIQMVKDFRKTGRDISWNVLAEIPEAQMPWTIRWDRLNLPAGFQLTMVEADENWDPVLDAMPNRLEANGGSLRLTQQLSRYIVTARLVSAVTFKFRPGWNLVSVPVELTTLDQLSLLTHEDIPFIWGWDGNAYVSMSEEPLEAKKGYWMFVDSDQPFDLTVTGIPIENTRVSIHDGHNLIGPVRDSINPVPFNDMLQSLWGWDTEKGIYVFPDDRYPTHEMPVKRTRGYWLESTGETKIW